MAGFSTGLSCTAAFWAASSGISKGFLQPAQINPGLGDDSREVQAKYATVAEETQAPLYVFCRTLYAITQGERWTLGTMDHTKKVAANEAHSPGDIVAHVPRIRTCIQAPQPHSLLLGHQEP